MPYFLAALDCGLGRAPRLAPLASLAVLAACAGTDATTGPLVPRISSFDAASFDAASVDVAAAGAGGARSNSGAAGRILFASLRAGDGYFHLFAMNADGTGATQLTHCACNDEQPSWSPNGKSIVFTSDRAGEGTHVYVMKADGSGIAALGFVPHVFDTSPAWSPDGRRIAFVSNRAMNGNDEIYTMAADGSDVRRITTTVGTASLLRHPSWSPRSDRIAYALDAGGLSSIWTMNADGTGARKLVDAAQNDMTSVDDPSWSPDGTTIALSGGGLDKDPAIYTIPVSSPGGLGRLVGASGPYVSLTQPTWSPKGDRLAFACSSVGGYSHVCEIAAGGSGFVDLGGNTFSGALDVAPAWSR